MNRPNILIVEDETITSHHLSSVLTRLGYHVTGIARNGAAALELIERFCPDLLLADIGLEGELDGVEVAALARKQHGIPTVFLTAYSDSETMRRARITEPYGFLVKPFVEQELQATVEIALQQKALRAEHAQEMQTNASLLVRTQEELSAVTARLFRLQEEERAEIARELHDDLGQRLALVQIAVESCWQGLPSGFKTANAPKWQSLIGDLGGLAAGLRNASHRLHPSILDDLGLTVALRQLAETFEERYSIPTNLSARSVPNKLGPQISLALYRIVQEALHNIAKHAGPEALVTISSVGGLKQIHLTVRDTGKGFDLQSPPTRGIGLISMAQRAEGVGGKFEIVSSPGRGTRIHVSVPLDQAGVVPLPAVNFSHSIEDIRCQKA